MSNCVLSPAQFNALLDELDSNSLKTLKEKNAKYAVNDNCLHNFYVGADILGGSPAQACWGYLTKHLVALRDMVERNDFHDRADFLEKCQDSINYIRFLWCIGNAIIGYDEIEKAQKFADFAAHAQPVTATIDTADFSKFQSAFSSLSNDDAMKVIDAFTNIKSPLSTNN